jgi:hypothetical protein
MCDRSRRRVSAAGPVLSWAPISAPHGTAVRDPISSIPRSDQPRRELAKRALQPLPHLGVKRIPEAVAQHVDREDGDATAWMVG